MRFADKMLEKLQPGYVDIIVLPEMAFTGLIDFGGFWLMLTKGYTFRDREHIESLMESETGPTYQWCKSQAIRLKSFVAAGYPLKTEEGK